MFHSGNSSFLKLPSALVNGDIVGISGQKKKVQFEKKKKRQRSETSCFQTDAELRACKDAEEFKIPISVSVGVFCTAL